jgi:predicted dehydrogenase
MVQVTPEKTVKVGVVGGGFGRTHILAYRTTPGVEVTAFCQRTKASAEQSRPGIRHPARVHRLPANAVTR